jgi:dynein heavy chain
MLGAGTDPRAREREFSVLAGSAASLINAHFVKPGAARTRFPPVLDKFSRTIGAPVSAMKYNLSPSSRIGANITPTARMIYLDHVEKCVRVLKRLDNAVTFQANQEYLQKPASVREELLFLVYHVQNPELESKIRAKRICFERYRLYIE